MNKDGLMIAVIIAVLGIIHIRKKCAGRKPTQTCFCYCDCGNELCGDGSYIGEDEALEIFSCKKCGKVSKWDFDAPAPLKQD